VPYVTLCEDVVSSTKLEVHNITIVREELSHGHWQHVK